MSRLSREQKRELKRAQRRSAPGNASEGQAPPGVTPIDVHVPASGAALVGGMPIVAAQGETAQDAVLNYLHRLALATGHPVLATVRDECIGFVVPLHVDVDGSSRYAGEPVRVGPPATAEPAPPTPDVPAMPVMPAAPVAAAPAAEAPQAPQVPQVPQVPQASPPAPQAPAPPEAPPVPARDKATHVLRAVEEPTGPTPSTFVLRAVPEPELEPKPLPAPAPATPAPAASAAEPSAPVTAPAPAAPAPAPASAGAPTFVLRAVPEPEREPEPEPESQSQSPQKAVSPPQVAAPVGEFGPATGYGPAVEPTGRPARPAPPVPMTPLAWEKNGAQEVAVPESTPRPPVTEPVPPTPKPAVIDPVPTPLPMVAPAPAPKPAPAVAAMPVMEPEPEPKPAPVRGFDAVAEAVLAPSPEDGSAAGAGSQDVPGFLAEPVAQINEAVKMGRIEAAAEMAERAVAEASASLGQEHPEVLRLRELTAYIAYLAGDALRSFHLSLDLAQVRRRHRDPRAAYGNVQSAAAAWRAVRDPYQGLHLGRDLIGVWSELAADSGPAADDIEQLESARSRMNRLAERARAIVDNPYNQSPRAHGQ
ncbi:hypothetical protein [Streptomyces sp. NPDC005485]|uniref:hypothetical protein n=1 Tax=Streptomyces sp. NPDC005485 TaxID=3155591 RepID=UPI0033BDE601